MGIAAVVAVAGAELAVRHGHGRVHAKVLLQGVQVGLADVSRHVQPVGQQRRGQGAQLRSAAGTHKSQRTM